MGRAGSSLHKALAPLGGKAVISHQFELVPPGSRIIVCTGNRAAQVRDYVELAHPYLPVEFVHVPDWDQPGSGPGATLLAARDSVGYDDMIFASCDTLWAADDALWASQGHSWAAVAPVPAGTALDRWCRIDHHAGVAVQVLDKVPGYEQETDAYPGLAMIRARDLAAFWAGVEGQPGEGECRDVAGLAALIEGTRLEVRRIAWTDTGDEAAYQWAVAAWSGYDWSKPDEVTYVLPDTGRVVKYRADHQSIERRARRQETIPLAVPAVTGTRPGFLACEYVDGVTGYQAAEADPDLVTKLLDWAQANLWRPVTVQGAARTCELFYREKTYDRVGMLKVPLRDIARDAADRVDWQQLAQGVVPVTFHGDFNLGNVIVRPDGAFACIDWREDFGGGTSWGDKRYDLGKLAAGLIVHWENAQRGDFRPWDARVHKRKLAQWLGGQVPLDVMVIAAVSLLNCAPLHAAPLDEILVARAAALLEVLAP